MSYTCVTALAGVLFGYGTGVMSVAILFIAKEFHLSAMMNGLVVGISLLGALFGALISGKASDRLGRKEMLIASAIIFIIGSLQTAFSASIAGLLMGRILTGIAIGVASYTAPLYISEIAPPRHRGALVSVNQLAISLGVLFSYIVSYFYASHEAWRWMLGLGAVPGICLLIGMIYLPNSPRWLLAQGRGKEAWKILQKIREADADIELEITGIQKALNDDVRDWRVLFSRKLRTVLWIGCGLAIIQQVTGINTILYYAPTILKMSGIASSSSAILVTIGIGGVFVLLTLVSLMLIDRLGRRTMLISGLIGMILGLSFLIWTFRHPFEHSARWLPIFSMSLFIMGFAISLGPITWLMIAEVYPLRIRGIGASLASVLNWGSNFVITATFLKIVELIDVSGAFSIYLIFSFLALLFAYFLVPETNGVSLEEIEERLLAGTFLRTRS